MTSPWVALRERVAAGETLTSAELADALLRNRADAIPDDMAVLLADRLRRAPAPKAGRRRRTDDERDLYVLSLHNRMTDLWFRAGGRRGQRPDAVAAVAKEYKLTDDRVNDILHHELGRARRANPTRAYKLEDWEAWYAKHPLPDAGEPAAPVEFDWTGLHITRVSRPKKEKSKI